MLFIIILGLTAKLASVSGECEVGTHTVSDFDWKKFIGCWYWLYQFPSEDEDNFDCILDNYEAPVGNTSKLMTYEYDITNSRYLETEGDAVNWNTAGSYELIDDDPIWDGRYYILAIDYDRYFITKFCSVQTEETSIYIVFRNERPDEATMKDVERDLQAHDLEFKQMAKMRSDHCLHRAACNTE